MPEASVQAGGGMGGRSNKRTALVLLSVVAVFFFGIMLKVWFFGK